MKKIMLMMLMGAMILPSVAKNSKEPMSPDVNGRVFDEAGEPMAYTNVVLLNNDSTFVGGAVTDVQGAFNIVVPASGGILKVSSVGYETQYFYVGGQQASDCVIKMKASAQTLSEVTVKSNLPKTRVKGDAMQTFVEGTILEKAGSTADLLNKIPSLSAEKNGGGVEVFGRGSAEVYINGRKVKDLRELDRLRAEQIKSVEVVNNPGARYSATTRAVVRIQLKKAQGEGFSFVDNALAEYQYKATATNNLNLNYRIGGLDVTGSFWAGSFGSTSNQANDLVFKEGNDVMMGSSKQDLDWRWNGISPQLQVNYQINDNHSLGAYYKWNRNLKNHSKGWFNTDIFRGNTQDERTESDIEIDKSFRKHIFNAYYNGRIGKLSIDLNIDGLFDDSDETNDTHEQYFAPGTITDSKIVNTTETSNNFWASKLIFSYPICKGNFSLGGEYSQTSRTDVYNVSANNGQNQGLELPVKATDSDIKESNAAGFVEYGRTFGKLYAQVGIRYEYLTNDYSNFGVKDEEVSRSYGDWFPSLVLSMPVKNVQMSLSYKKDISRPSYQNLSSSTIYINRYSYQTGNPFLQPVYTHNLVLNGAYKWAALSFIYSNIKNDICMKTTPMPNCPDPMISLVHPENSEKTYNRLIINNSARPTIGCWHPMWSIGLILQDYKTTDFKGNDVTLNHPFWQFIWNNDWELKHAWRLKANFQMTTRGDYNTYRMQKSPLMTVFGIQKDFSLKKMGTLTAELNLNDMFETSKSATKIFGKRELTMYNEARREFSFNLTWKFNEASKKYRGSGAGQKQKSRM